MPAMAENQIRPIMPGDESQQLLRALQEQRRIDESRWTTSDTASVWAMVAICALGGWVVHEIYKEDVRQQELKRHLPKFPIEQVDNQCKPDTMTIGDLKLRMPKTGIPQVVYSKDQPPPQK
jgi:hypothetical protein